MVPYNIMILLNIFCLYLMQYGRNFCLLKTYNTYQQPYQQAFPQSCGLPSGQRNFLLGYLNPPSEVIFLLAVLNPQYFII